MGDNILIIDDPHFMKTLGNKPGLFTDGINVPLFDYLVKDQYGSQVKLAYVIDNDYKLSRYKDRHFNHVPSNNEVFISYWKNRRIRPEYNKTGMKQIEFFSSVLFPPFTPYHLYTFEFFKNYPKQLAQEQYKVRKCSYCEKPALVADPDVVQVDTTTYHRACYNASKAKQYKRNRFKRRVYNF